MRAEIRLSELCTVTHKSDGRQAVLNSPSFFLFAQGLKSVHKFHGEESGRGGDRVSNTPAASVEMSHFLPK